MSVISNGRPERKDVTAQLERWFKESEEQKRKQEQERKRRDLEASKNPVAR